MKLALIGNDARGLILFRLDMIEALQKSGIQVYAFFPKRTANPKDIDLACRLLRQKGAEPFPLPLDRTGLNPLSDLNYRRRITQLIRKLGCDMAFAYGIKPIIHGLPAAKKGGATRCFAMIAGLGSAFMAPDTISKWLIYHIAKQGYYQALSFCEHTFFQNKDDRTDFIRMKIINSKAKTSLIAGSGVNLSRFPAQPLPQTDEKALRFIYVGRLIKTKGIIDFLDAAKHIKQNYPKAEFWVVGGEDTNPDGLTLECLKKKYPHITFYGAVDSVAPLLAKSHVFVLPSYYREGIPRSALEAMATGRALILADSPGTREAIQEHKNGLLVPPQTPKAIAKAMQHYLETPNLLKKHAQESLILARNHFAVEKVNAYIVEIINFEMK